MGVKPGQGAIIGLICLESSCQIEKPPSIDEPRNAVIVAAIVDGVSAHTLAEKFNLSRQRIYQIVDAYRNGR